MKAFQFCPDWFHEVTYDGSRIGVVRQCIGVVRKCIGV